MGILKKYQKNRFTQVDNEVIVRADLSAKAKGILLYLLSKPGNWSPNITDITNNMTDGRDGVRSGMHELVAKGYARFGHTQDEAGKLTGSYWEVSDYPMFVETESRENRKSENPTIGKSNTNNKEFNNTESSNTETPIVPKGTVDVNEWWGMIPSSRKIDKKACTEKWNRLSDLERNRILEHWPRYVMSVRESKNGAKGWDQFVRHPKTYLNNRNWEDGDIANQSQVFNSSKRDEAIEKSKESLAILDQLDND